MTKIRPGGLSTSVLNTTYARKVELNAVTDGGMSTTKTGAQNYAAANTFFNTTVKDLINAGISVKVVIPPGDYNMDLGLVIGIPAGKGGFHVSAYGARLIFSATPTGQWAMFKVRPDSGWTTGTPPANTNGYIRDIFIEGLGIYEPDAVAHQGAEETHGINVGYAKNVHVWNCRVEGTGDEPLEFDYVEGFSIHDNYLTNCKAATGTVADGSNISIKNGCRRGQVYANVIDTSVGGGAKGLGVKIIEAATVEDIDFFDNTIRNLGASTTAGLYINTTGAAAKRVTFRHNTVDGAPMGAGLAGSNLIEDCAWIGNTFRNCTGNGVQIQLQGTSALGNRFDYNNILDSGNAAAATTSYGMYLAQDGAGCWASVQGNKIRNVQGRAIFLWGNDIKVVGGEIRNANLAGTANQAAVGKGSGTGHVVEGITIASPGARGIQAIDYVRNCRITGNTGDAAVNNFKEIIGGYYAGRISGIQAGGSVQNCEVDASAYTAGNAIDLGTQVDCRVVGNRIRAAVASSRKAVGMSAGADRNLVFGNSHYGTLDNQGASTVVANNVAMIA